MKKISLLSFALCLLFSYSSYADKPIVTKHKDKWYRLLFNMVVTAKEYEVDAEGNQRHVRTTISCSSPGASWCSGNETLRRPDGYPELDLSEPELNLIDDLFAFPENKQTNQQVYNGTYSSTITVQHPGNPPVSYVYTVSWTTNMQDESSTYEIYRQIY